MSPIQRAYFELHLAVLLFGITAILGDLISLSALTLVWWRVLLTTVSLLFLIRWGARLRQLPRQLIFQYLGIGVLVALHWICFFGAIKFANASICLVCMATTSFFTSFLEPLLLKQRIKGYEILLGLLILPGMVMVVNNTDWSMMPGVWIGLLSALLAALFATLNKKLVDEADPMDITFLELGSAWVFLSLVLPVYYLLMPAEAFLPTLTDLGYLLILSLLCTTLAYVLSLRALKYISAFAANLTVNLEPVYGIILAWFLLGDGEELNLGFYLGCTIILLAVFSYPWLRRRFA